MGATSSICCYLGPVGVEPDDAATVYEPQKASTAQIHQRIGSVAAEQRKSIPPQVGGALRQAFGRNEEAVAVGDELIPSVGRDVSRVMVIIEPRDTLKPTSWHADDVAEFIRHAVRGIARGGHLWRVGLGAGNGAAIAERHLRFSVDDRGFRG